MHGPQQKTKVKLFTFQEIDYGMDSHDFYFPLSMNPFCEPLASWHHQVKIWISQYSNFTNVYANKA